MAQIDLAWAAGLFEGEGTVRINKATKRNLGHLVVSVGNTDYQVVEFFQSRWPGMLRRYKVAGPNRRPAWVWAIAARKAVVFLEAILPYVVRDIVKARIDCALKFQRDKAASVSRGVTDEYRAEQFGSYLWMKELNARGSTARPYPHAPEWQPARKRGG